MQFDLKLEENGVAISTEIFETRVEGLMRDYLRNDCILDYIGINRVIPQLRKTFLNSCQGIYASISVEPDELGPLNEDGQLSQDKLDAMSNLTNQLGEKVSLIVFESQIKMMYAMAKTLADHDERIYRRLRN